MKENSNQHQSQKPIFTMKKGCMTPGNIHPKTDEAKGQQITKICIGHRFPVVLVVLS